jgi:hypothetical protein
MQHWCHVMQLTLSVCSDVEAMDVSLTRANCFSLTRHANCCLVDTVLHYMTTAQFSRTLWGMWNLNRVPDCLIAPTSKLWSLHEKVRCLLFYCVYRSSFIVFILTHQRTIYIYHKSIALYNVHSYVFRHLCVILREFYICASLSYRNTWNWSCTIP